MFRASSLEAAKPEHIPFQFPTCDPLRHRFHAPSNPPVSAFTAPPRSSLPPGRPGAGELVDLREQQASTGAPLRGLLGKGPGSEPCFPAPYPGVHLPARRRPATFITNLAEAWKYSRTYVRRLIHLPPISQLHRASVFTSHPPPETCQAPPLWSLSPRDAALPQSKASS